MPASSVAQPMELAKKYVALIVKYKRECLLGTLAVTLLGTLLIAKLPNVYEATTTILVDPQQVPEKYVSAAVSSDPYTRLNTITQQVLSRSRLQEIIDKYTLYSDRRSILSPEEVVEEMRHDITIEVKQGSGPELSTFTLTYQGRQPTLVADVANELASSFIKWNVSTREEQVAGTRDFLSTELHSAKQNLEQQEDSLRQFKMRHLGETPDQTASNLSALTNLRTALQANIDAMSRLDSERIMLTRAPEQVPVVSSAPVVLTQRERLEQEKRQLEASIEQLREHYSDRYPDVLKATRRLERIKEQISALPTPPVATSHGSEGSGEKSIASVRVELVEKELKRLQAEQEHIQEQINSYQGKVDVSPIREQQLVELTRNYDISKLHYQALLDKNFNVAMAADLEKKQKAERFRVLDLARTPQKPVKPNRKRLIALAGIAGLGLSILCVFAKEELSPGIRTEVELKSLLPVGVRVVGFIPRIVLASDALRDRRFSIVTSVACVLLCLALIGVIRGIHPL
jgi:succinoglycan biosynthesis transport protein ExoP